MKRIHHLVRAAAVGTLTVTTTVVAGAGGSPIAAASGPCAPYVLPGLPGGGGGGEVIAISAAGLYGGDAPDTDGHWHAVYWTHTGNDLSSGWTIHRVPSPITDDFIGDINSHGVMVGTGSDPVTGNGVGYVFDSNTGTVTMLPGLGGGFDYDRRLNDAGVVAGTSVDTRGVFRSVTWTPPYTKANSLPDAGASRSYGYPIQHYTTGQQAMGINNAGQVVGFSFNGGHYTDTQDWAKVHEWHAWVAPLLQPEEWQPTGAPHRLPTGNLQGPAWAINDSGLVVGSVITDPNTYAARPEAWLNGANVDMGAPADIVFGNAYGVSQGGWAAGGYIESDNTTSRAFTWDEADGFRTLDPPAPYTNSWAHGVSDALGNVGGSADDGNLTVPVVWHC